MKKGALDKWDGRVPHSLVDKPKGNVSVFAQNVLYASFRYECPSKIAGRTLQAFTELVISELDPILEMRRSGTFVSTHVLE